MTFAIRGPFDRVEQSHHPRTVREVSRNEERPPEKKRGAQTEEGTRKPGAGRENEKRGEEEQKKRSGPSPRHIDLTA